MKKYVGILLLLCLCAPFVCTYSVLQYKKQQVKREVKWRMIAGIPNTMLEQMRFSIADAQSQLNWKHAKEFEYLGEWYDIVAADTIGDTVYYSLWWDKEETHLNKQLALLIHDAASKSPENRDNKNRLSFFLKSLFYQEVDENIDYYHVRTNHKFVYQFSTESALQTLKAPPPEFM